MSLKDKCLMIGLGNCGSKIVKMFNDLGYHTMFANGSQQDLKLLGNIKNVYKLEGFDGFGGHRERAMDCLAANEAFTEALENIKQKIVFLIYSTGGSTGSGLSTIVAAYIQDYYDGDKIVCTVPVLPSADESINKHRNAYQAMQELMELEHMGATFILDNDSEDDLKKINRIFVLSMNSFLTDESIGEMNNFDESERIEMLAEAGSMMISLSKGKSVSRILEKNIYAVRQEDRVCGNIGIIHNGIDDISLDELIADVGKPLNIYEGFGGKSSLVAISGLSFPLDHITKIGSLAVEGQKERQRNRFSAKDQTLPELEFDAIQPKKTAASPKNKKVSSRDALMALRAKTK